MTLKPCPFCGELKARFQPRSCGAAIQIACENCGAAGPPFDMSSDFCPTSSDAEREAAEHWNDRPGEDVIHRV